MTDAKQIIQTRLNELNEFAAEVCKITSEKNGTFSRLDWSLAPDSLFKEYKIYQCCNKYNTGYILYAITDELERILKDIGEN